MSALIEFDVVLMGCGKMGGALVAGAVDRGAVDPDSIELRDPDESSRLALADQLGADPEYKAERKRIVILAMKPRDVPAVVSSLDVDADDILVSVAAGVSFEALDVTPATAVRTMPNTPALVGAGVTGLFFDGAPVPAVVDFFEAVGSVVVLGHESEFDALTAISGSGPAYIFQAIEALADGGVKMGLKREVAIELAIQTVRGAGELASQSALHTAELKDQVASPGGTTIAALTTLDKHGFRAALIAAVEAAARRSREMGQKLTSSPDRR